MKKNAVFLAVFLAALICVLSVVGVYGQTSFGDAPNDAVLLSSAMQPSEETVSEAEQDTETTIDEALFGAEQDAEELGNDTELVAEEETEQENKQEFTVLTAVQGNTVLADGYYEIRSAVSGKNMEVYGVSHTGGAKITQWYSTGGKNQKWKVENQNDGTVKITNVESGLVLDYNQSNGQYEQWNWHGRANQRWQLTAAADGNYYIKNAASGFVMDVLYGNMNNGRHIVSYAYNGGVNQQWQFIKTDANDTPVITDGYYEIQSVVSGKNLAVDNSSHAGGAKILQWSKTDSNSQKWKLEVQSDKTVKIVNAESGLALDYNQSNGQYEQWDWHGRDNQRWQVIKAENGNYYIRNVATNNAVDVLYGNTNNGQHVVEYGYNGGENQQWKLVPVKVQTALADGYYEIRSTVSGKNMEVYAVSHTGGAKITQWYSTGGKNQKWKVENQGDGTAKITNVESGLALDYNQSNGQYEQWDWHGRANQRWRVTKAADNSYYIQNAANGCAADVLYGNMNDGQYIVNYAYNGGINQQWQFIKTDPTATKVVSDGYYEIKSVVSHKNLDVYNGNKYGGGTVMQWSISGRNNQRWKLVTQNDGTVQITNAESGLALDHNGSNNQYEQWDWHGRANQRWQISKSVDGNYYIRSAATNNAMDVLYGNTDNGQNVVDYGYNGGENQQWQLVPVSEQTLQLDKNAPTVSLKSSVNTAYAGEHITLTATPSQGASPLQYEFIAVHNGQETVIQAYSTSAVCNYTLPYAGGYTFRVRVSDGVARTQQVEIAFTAKQSSVTLKKNTDDTVAPGKHVTFTANGYIANAQYEYIVEHNGVHTTMQIGPKNTYVWVPFDEGDYKMIVKVRTSGLQVQELSQTMRVVKDSSHPKVLHGVDVSKWQSNIDWARVKRTGKVDFAIIQIGYGREVWQKDKYFEQNYTGAKEQGISVGVYQYSYADGVEDALREADVCLQWLNDRAIDNYVAYDIEEDKAIAHLSRQQVSEMAIAWCRKIEAAGYKPMIYTNPTYLINKFDAQMIRDAGYDLWIANYKSGTYNWPYPAKIWQYSSDGFIDGIPGRVDVNYMYAEDEYNGGFPLPDGQKGMCTGSTVNVRTGPGTWNGALFQAHYGYNFTIIKEQNGWYQVSFGADRIGWIIADYVRRT